MSIPKKDVEQMKNLAKEGKQISKIVTQDFPQYSYWDIYSEVYGSGMQGAQGVKVMITKRLNQLVKANTSERQEIVEELNYLICDIYNRCRSNQSKLDNIRKILQKK
ncbi:MAG: hypothetical protein Q8N90_01500 [bacterium]|nr:hypothetical protein [bacterium]